MGEDLEVDNLGVLAGTVQYLPGNTRNHENS
jgi:hypothetical protein